MPLNITFLGHSGFVFDDGQHRVAVDPFLTGNPLATHTPDQVACEYVALSHGHGDHFGDTLPIARANDATVIAAFEVCEYVNEQGHAKTDPGNPGGRVYTDFGYVAFTPAFHSSSYEGRYMGQPCGLILSFEKVGVKVYHTGDTALFSDMRLIGEIAQPDVMCVCIGDRFTMTPQLASRAVDFVQPKAAIPIHYKTFPVLAQSAEGFEPTSATVREMEPGEVWVYPS